MRIEEREGEVAIVIFRRGLRYTPGFWLAATGLPVYVMLGCSFAIELSRGSPDGLWGIGILAIVIPLLIAGVFIAYDYANRQYEIETDSRKMVEHCFGPFRTTRRFWMREEIADLCVSVDRSNRPVKLSLVSKAGEKHELLEGVRHARIIDAVAGRLRAELALPAPTPRPVRTSVTWTDRVLYFVNWLIKPLQLTIVPTLFFAAEALARPLPPPRLRRAILCLAISACYFGIGLPGWYVQRKRGKAAGAMP